MDFSVCQRCRLVVVTVASGPQHSTWAFPAARSLPVLDSLTHEVPLHKLLTTSWTSVAMVPATFCCHRVANMSVALILRRKRCCHIFPAPHVNAHNYHPSILAANSTPSFLSCLASAKNNGSNAMVALQQGLADKWASPEPRRTNSPTATAKLNGGKGAPIFIDTRLRDTQPDLVACKMSSQTRISQQQDDSFACITVWHNDLMSQEENLRKKLTLSHNFWQNQFFTHIKFYRDIEKIFLGLITHCQKLIRS